VFMKLGLLHFGKNIHWSEISGSHGGEHEYDSLPGYSAVWSLRSRSGDTKLGAPVVSVWCPEFL
jgi:hypothetical protein